MTIWTDILLVAGGFLMGFLFGHMLRCPRRSEEPADAPVPDLGYDPTNPINAGGRRDEPEVIETAEGIKLYRIWPPTRGDV